MANRVPCRIPCQDSLLLTRELTRKTLFRLKCHSTSKSVDLVYYPLNHAPLAHPSRGSSLIGRDKSQKKTGARSQFLLTSRSRACIYSPYIFDQPNRLSNSIYLNKAVQLPITHAVPRRPLLPLTPTRRQQLLNPSSNTYKLERGERGPWFTSL